MMTSPPSGTDVRGGAGRVRHRGGQPARRDPVHPISGWCRSQCCRRPHPTWDPRHLGKRARRRCARRLPGRRCRSPRGQPAGAPGRRAHRLDVQGRRGEWDPEVLQVRHQRRSPSTPTVLTSDLLAFAGLDHLHLTGITLGISPVVRPPLACSRRAIPRGDRVVRPQSAAQPVARPGRDARRHQRGGRPGHHRPPRPRRRRLLTGHTSRGDRQTSTWKRGREVVVKLGAGGAQAWTADGQTADPASFVNPIDTVGAGDGFAAGYLDAFLAGGGLQERVDQAAAVGALVTTRRGDLAAMPQREEVDALISSTPAQPDPRHPLRTAMIHPSARRRYARRARHT